MTDLSLLGDIDIDTPDRTLLLQEIDHVPAATQRNGKSVRHNTGVYFHKVPTDPFAQLCSLSYDKAEQMGCYKIDLLNNHIYSKVRDETHLIQLMETAPMWHLLEHEEFVKEVAHINQHYDLVRRLKPSSVTELAMVLALIRPGKRHLVSRCEKQGWRSIEPEIWEQDTTGYTFKKSHAISLSVSIVVQMNLLVEELTHDSVVV
jgi:hypothetical protein